MLFRSVTVASFIATAIGHSVPAPACRILPKDPSWPSQHVWDTFNRSIDGRLIKTIPIGSPCHDPTYDDEQCNVVKNNWHNPAFHELSSSSLMDPIFLNKSCDPFDPRETPCKIGAYVQYAVNVSSPHHVIKTIQFVKKHNIRFVVKNTGHDYMGRSTGSGALSVWMHHLTEVTWIPEYEGPSYTGPAFKFQTGVLGIDVAREANRRGVVVVGGECPTVAFAGGYIQGGGHSALSSIYGIAADYSLEFEVITTDGHFVRASPSENQDLYWALSGGGGGAYGIVWSATVQAHPDRPVTIASLNFTSQGITQEVFWKALDAYQASTPGLTDAKLWAIAQYTSSYFSMYPILAVDKTPEEVSALLKPLLDTLDELGVKYATGAERYSTYLDAYSSVGFLLHFTVADFLYGSRLLPRSLWEDNETLESLKAAIRFILQSGAAVFEFVLKGTLEVAGHPNNAVFPAWREAERHSVIAVPLVDGEPMEDVLAKQRKITNELVPRLEALAPGCGAYHNEADPNEPDFKQTFYGSNYDRLLEIKDKWDPDQILYGTTSVGGDRWFQTEEGRLCKTERHLESVTPPPTFLQSPFDV